MISLFQDNQSDGAVLDAEDNSTPTLTGDEQDSSSVMSELDLQNAQPPAAGWLEQELLSSQANNNSSSNNTNPTLVNVAAKCPDRGGGEGSSLFASSVSSDTTLDDNCDRNMSASSTASVSDYSDDGSLRSAAPRGSLPSPSSCSSVGSDGASGAVRTGGDACGGKRSNPKAASLCPRPTVGPTTASFSNLARFSAAHARSTVTSGAGAPILPFTFKPSFHAGGAASCAGGGGGGSSSSASSAISTLPALGGLHAATVLTAASDAATQALTAGWKRFRGGEAVGEGGGSVLPKSEVEERRHSAVPIGVASNGAGGVGAIPPSVRKRAKREERLMKNREAANRSRNKVALFTLFTEVPSSQQRP